MDSTLFQLSKVRRLINTQGTEFTFKVWGVNSFGEPEEVVDTITFKGVYHETTSYLQKTSTEDTTIRQKFYPMIVCLWSDAKRLSHKNTLDYNGRVYTIGEIKNVSEANIVGEVSLEEVQYG